MGATYFSDLSRMKFEDTGIWGIICQAENVAEVDFKEKFDLIIYLHLYIGIYLFIGGNLAASHFFGNISLLLPQRNLSKL